MLDNPDLVKNQAKEYAGKMASAVTWLWSMVPPMHPAGWPFVAGFAVVTLLLSLIWEGFFCIGLVLTLWCTYFFRNPARVTPQRNGLVIAPADGMVSMIEKTSLPAEFDHADDEIYTRVSIFLNVFDVHVQRVPYSGKVLESVYRPGKFLNACLDKASEDNERSSVLMETSEGKKIAFVQIAGLIARRIINGLQKDQAVTAGELYGLIRFGSRVDVYLPAGVAPLVCIGQRMIGGETVMADLTSSETQRTGVSR
jgi:phosphatidylserine decarboxylase